MDSWVVDGGRSNYRCPECWSHSLPVQTDECANVCPDCGLVITDILFYKVPCVYRALKSSYKREFHWNERMALFKMEDPWIPDDIMDLIEEEAAKEKYPCVDEFECRDISTVLTAIEVPKWMQEKYRSQKFKRRPMASLLKFREKWLQIKWRLTGKKPVEPKWFCQLGFALKVNAQ